MKEIPNLEMRGDGPRRRERAKTGEASRGTGPRRTTFHEDDLHVGTIVEYVDDGRKGLGFCAWYTAGGGGQGNDFADAERQLREALLK